MKILTEKIKGKHFIVSPNIKKYDFERPFKPWFRKILVNTAINQLKKSKKFRMEKNFCKQSKEVSKKDNTCFY